MNKVQQGLLALAAGAVVALPGAATSAAANTGSDFDPGTRGAPDRFTVTLGDFTGDDRADVGRIAATGEFEVFSTDGAGGFAATLTVGQNWGGFDRVFGMDFDGDGKQDVIARDTSGTLWLYQGNGAGERLTGHGIKIGVGWGPFTEIFTAGNLTVPAAQM